MHGPGHPPARPVHAASHPQRVLIVEDEPALLRALRINLRARGYEVTTATTGRAALAEAARRPPDAVLLDLGLPDVDGTGVIEELRTWSRAPVIVLSGRTGSGDKIGALDAGANDYVTKPFDIEELLARLRSALRRDDPLGAADIRLGAWRIDLTAYRATRNGDESQTARLTPTEWRLLEILLRHPAAVGAHAVRLPHRGVGARLRAEHQLPALSHGQAAAQAGGGSVPAGVSADRTRHGVPLPAGEAGRLVLS